MTIVRKTVLASAVALAVVVGVAASVARASTPKTAPRVAPAAQVQPRPQFDRAFATLADTLPVCRPTDVTNCRTGTAAHLEASVQSKTATIYFELRNGVVTDLEVYPVAR